MQPLILRLPEQDDDVDEERDPDDPEGAGGDYAEDADDEAEGLRGANGATNTPPRPAPDDTRHPIFANQDPNSYAMPVGTPQSYSMYVRAQKLVEDTLKLDGVLSEDDEIDFDLLMEEFFPQGDVPTPTLLLMLVRSLLLQDAQQEQEHLEHEVQIKADLLQQAQQSGTSSTRHLQQLAADLQTQEVALIAARSRGWDVLDSPLGFDHVDDDGVEALYVQDYLFPCTDLQEQVNRSHQRMARAKRNAALAEQQMADLETESTEVEEACARGEDDALAKAAEFRHYANLYRQQERANGVNVGIFESERAIEALNIKLAACTLRMDDLERQLGPKAFALWALEKAHMQMVAEDGKVI